MDRELLDAEAVAGDLVPAGSVFAFLAGHRQELFPDSFTADLFPLPLAGRRCRRTWWVPCWCSRSCMTCPMSRRRTR
jgi:hypothetical protein